MLDGTNQSPAPKRRPRALFVLGVAGLLVFACCGTCLVRLPPAETALEGPQNTGITLAHHERVLLAAERMHRAGVRAQPEDTLNTQLEIAAFGKRNLKSPRRDIQSEWRLAGFSDERCYLKVQADGPWSDKAARIVVAEFLRFAGTLCPAAAKTVASSVHSVKPGYPLQREADGYKTCVTLVDEAPASSDQRWVVLIELLPLRP